MSFHFSRAYFCQDCEHVGDNSERCSKCGSIAIHQLSKWLNKIPAEDRPELARFAYQVGSAMPVGTLCIFECEPAER